MTARDPDTDRDDTVPTSPRRIRMPGFAAETEVGLGAVIKRATSLAGIRPCGPCAGRAARLDRRVVFTGRRQG